MTIEPYVLTTPWEDTEKYIGLLHGDILEVRKEGSRQTAFRAIRMNPGEEPAQTFKRLHWFPYTVSQCGVSISVADTPVPVKYDVLTGIKFAVRRSEYNAVCADVSEGNADQYFDKIRNWLLQTFPKLVSEEKTKLGKDPGRKGKLQRPDGSILFYRLYSVGKRIFLLTAALPPGEDTSAAERYFSSFQTVGTL